MTPKIFLGLTLAAAVSVTAAAITYYENRTWGSSVEQGEALFQNLTARQDEIALITVTKGEETINIERTEDGWGIRERSGFRANANEVRETIVGLTQMQIIESKTSNEERYELLNLADPTAADAKSKLVQLRDAEGNAIAELVLGKVKYGVLGPGRNGVYARVPGNPQSWLVSGDVGAPLDVRGWADKTVLDIAQADIARVTISHADGEQVVYVREEQEGGEATFRVDNLPEGATLKSDADIGFQVRSVGQLELWDVRENSGGEVPEGSEETTVEIETVTGLHVAVHMVSDGADENWLSVFAWGTGDAAEEARALNAETRGWDFLVQSYKADVYGKRIADLIEAPQEDSGS